MRTKATFLVMGLAAALAILVSLVLRNETPQAPEQRNELAVQKSCDDHTASYGENMESSGKSEAGAGELSLDGVKELVAGGGTEKLPQGARDQLASRTVELKEGAAIVMNIIEASDRLNKLAMLGQALSDDAEFARLLRGEIEVMLSSTDAEKRVRAILLCQGLAGEEGLEQWRSHVVSDHDPNVRARLLLGVQLEEEGTLAHPILETILHSLQSDPDPQVRRAAIQALPVGLDEGTTLALMQRAAMESAPEVRSRLLDCVGAQRLKSRALLSRLKGIATDPSEEQLVCKTALRAIFKMHYAHHGLLQPSEVEELEQLSMNLARMTPAEKLQDCPR